MRNSENSSTRSKLAALTRIGLLVLIFAVVFATVLSCGAFGESATLNNGSVENVAEARYDNPITGGSPNAHSAGGWPSIRTVKEAIYNSGSYTFTIDLSNANFAGGFTWVSYKTASTGQSQAAASWTPGGASAFGAKQTERCNVTYSVAVAVNIELGDSITQLLSAGYDVTLNSWTAGRYVYWDDSDSPNNYMGINASSNMSMSASTLAQDKDNGTGNGTIWKNIGNFSGSGGNTGGHYPSENASGDWGFSRKDEQATFDYSLPSSSTVVTLGILRERTSYSAFSGQAIGVAVDDAKISFTVSQKSGMIESTKPEVAAGSMSFEGDGEDATFSGLTIPSDSVFYGAYVTQQGSYNTANYELNTVTSTYHGQRSGFNYYKSVSFTASDGSLDQAAYSSGLKQVTLSKGGESLTVIPGQSKNNGSKFRLEMGALNECGLQAEVRAYFAESGTYTITLTDNGSNPFSLTVTIGGIDLTDPTATGSVSDSLATSWADLDSKNWAVFGAEVATINGMPSGVNLPAGDSAWAYYYDVSYSFFKPSSAPAPLSDDMKTRIKNGEFYPFAFTSSAYPVYFSYNTSTGAVRYGVGDGKVTTASLLHSDKVMPLSGEKVSGKVGYYTITIYVADVAGNVQAQPFVYYLKVDSTTVSDGATSYTYGVDKTSADGWINSYMLGEDEEVYVDITFKLNPSGNIITFNYGGNYYDSSSISDAFNFSATVTPVSGTAAPTVEVTGGENGKVTLSGTELAELVSGTTTLAEKSVPRAVLKAQISAPSGSGADWTVTLTLVYSRGSTPGEEGQDEVVGEFNINNANAIGVASVFGQTASFNETVNVKVDTQAIADISFDDAGNYVSAGDYSLADGGISIGTDSVAGRTWYTTDGALGLTSNTNAYTINEYQLDQSSEYKNYATYFGWKIYTDGTTVNDDIKTDLAAFKSEVEGAGTGMAGAFETFFGAEEGENLWQVNRPSEQSNLLSASTDVFVQYGRAGVRVLYIMTLDQAGNANFAIYYLFVDPTSYEMTFEIPADYIEQFSALDGVSFTATDFITQGTATFKRGENIQVTVNGLPTGYVPYTVSKVIGEQVVEFYNQNLTGDPTSGTYGMGGFIDGAITTPNDYAGGNSIAFVLDQASNLGKIGDGTNLGLQFTFRQLVNLSTVTAVTYNGYAVADETNYDKTLHVINVRSTAADFDTYDEIEVRKAAYAQLTWSGSGLAAEDNPINVGKYTSTGVNLKDNPYYISDTIESISLTINKREIDLTGKVGTFDNGTYGDITDTVFDSLKDDAVKALSVAVLAGVADLGQDNSKTLADIIAGSGLVLVNGTAVASFNGFSAGNLNADDYTVSLSSACTADNYTFKLSVSFSVAKRELEVTASGSKTYGEADGDIYLTVDSETALYGNTIGDVFPKLGTSGSLTAILGAGSADARNYTYENQGTDNYTNAGTYNITAVNVPSANLSSNFTVVLKSGSTYTVDKLNVYIVPDSGQVITTLTGYNISYTYRDAESGGDQITDGRIIGQIVAGTFVAAEEFVEGNETYNVKVGTSFTLTNPEVVNLNLIPVTDGITITLDYDWDKTVITITFKVAPTATYMVNFDNGLLAYATHKDNFAYSYSVTGGGTPVEGLPEGVTISWTTGSLRNYNAATAQADTSYTVVLDDIKIMKDGAVDDSGLYSVVVGATVTVERLHVSLTPSFTDEKPSKVYGDADNWSGKYTVTPSVADGVTLVDSDFLSTLRFTGQLGRALYNASGFVRAGAANDPVNKLLGSGEYYGAYTVSSYTCNNSNVIVDDISVDVLKEIEFAVTARPITAGDVTATGMNKPVPTGDANVPYTDNPFTINNMVAGDDVFIAYTSAVYVKRDGGEFTEDELKGLKGDIGDLDIQISGLVLAGDDAANYELSGAIAGEGYIFEIVGEGNDFKIFAYKFSGITSGDVVVTKVYDANAAITEANFTISGVLKKVQDTFPTSFYILGRRYGAYDYRMQLQRVDAGTYTTASFAFFVEGLSAVSFEVPDENSPFQVADSDKDHLYNGMSGVYIVVFDTTVVIEQYQLQLDEIKLTPEYTERHYDGTNLVKYTFAWADGADTTIFTSAALTNLRLSATFSIDSANAGTHEGVTVSGFNPNPQSNFAPAFGNAELTDALVSQVITVKPIPLNVTFAFVPAVYGSAEAQLSSGYTVKIDPAYQFSGWEAELEAISIEVIAGTTKFTYWDKATDTAYPYVQYDASGNVRLHDIKYEGVLFEALSGAVNLANYTFEGNSISEGDEQGSSGVIEAVAELTPKPLTFNTGYFVNIFKVYDGTTDANELLASKIGSEVNAVLGNGLVNGDDKKLGIAFTAAYSNANVGTGRDIVMSGIALVANDNANSYIAKSYSLTDTSVTIQGCSIKQAPLQVVFTLPTKTYDGTKFVDSVEGAVYYVLGGERGDFKTDKDRSSYRVTYLAAGYDNVNAGESITGIFIDVKLVSTNSSVVNYKLVDANGDELPTATYTSSNTVSAEAVARYSTSAGYEYLVPSTGGTSYTVIAATGKIEKAVYTVTVTDTLTKEFDNTDAYNGDLNAIRFTVSGLADTSGITITGATFASANAGTWDVTFTLDYKGTDQNYTVSQTAVAKGVITKRTLTVSLANADFEYGFGGSAPAYADRLAYSVRIDDADYAVVVQGGVAYITAEGYKALAGADAGLPSQTVTVDEVVYYAMGGSVSEITLTSAAFRQTNGKWVGVDEYDVTAIAGSADNFDLTLADGQKVNVVPATLTVSAKGDYEYVVDTAIADLEAKVLGELVPDGITNGDVFASAVSGIKVSFGDLAVNSAPASEFAITVNVADADSANYTLAAGANTYYVTVVLPELSVTAKSGQSSIYDGTDRLADDDFLAALVNRKTDGVEKAYTFEVVGEEADFAIKNAGTYAFDIKVTCAYSGLEGYSADNAAYATEATISVAYDVNKAALTISRSGKIATIYYTAKAQKLTDYDEFFAFEGAVAGEEQAMLEALATSARYNGNETFRDAGAYEVALNATEGVFANYNVTSGVTLLNVRKAPVYVKGTVTEGDIGSDVAFGVTVTGVVRAEGCPVDDATVGKLSTTVKYSSGATPVDEIEKAGVYNYVITLSDSNYEIVSGSVDGEKTLGASGTLTVTVKVVTENDSETAEKKAEVVFETPQTRAWTLSSYELAESNSTYIAYSSEAAKLAGTGETVEIGGVVRLELVSGTTTINATTTGKLGETVEITVKLPSALSSGTSGYTIYERQKDGSLKEVSDYVVNDGYFTYNSDLISDLVFVRIVGSGVPFWIWILVAVLAALIILAIILAAFIGRKDRSTTPPPAAPPAEPPVEDAPVSHDGALPAADVDIDIPDAPAHIGGGDRPPLIGTR